MEDCAVSQCHTGGVRGGRIGMHPASTPVCVPDVRLTTKCGAAGAPRQKKRKRAKNDAIAAPHALPGTKHCNMCSILSSIQVVTCTIWRDGSSSLPYYAPHCTDVGDSIPAMAAPLVLPLPNKSARAPSASVFAESP
eukprot:gene13434-biopygen11067